MGRRRASQGMPRATMPAAAPSTADRLEHLRAERLSWADLAELQGLADAIPADDLELREAAGLPE